MSTDAPEGLVTDEVARAMALSQQAVAQAVSGMAAAVQALVQPLRGGDDAVASAVQGMSDRGTTT